MLIGFITKKFNIRNAILIYLQNLKINWSFSAISNILLTMRVRWLVINICMLFLSILPSRWFLGIKRPPVEAAINALKKMQATISDKKYTSFVN